MLGNTGLLGTQGQVFLKAKRSKHRRRLGFETSSGNELRLKHGLAAAGLKQQSQQ
jgi:hypothetical protein